MSDDDLIRRGDALNAVQEWTYCCNAEDAIAALPAVSAPHGVDAEAVARLIGEQYGWVRTNSEWNAAIEAAAAAAEYVIRNIDILKADGETYETPRVQKIARGLVDVARQDILALRKGADHD